MAVKKPAAKQTAAKKTTTKAAAKPAPKAAAAATEDVFGVSDVAELIKVRTGDTVKTRDLRTLLRKMARDGRLQREIIAGNRARWEFDGADDPNVEKIIEAYEAGELAADKAEKLQALKDRKAAQRAAAKDAEESDEDEELEEDDEE